ncbi:MAG: methyltransferase domain-containing protein [Gemmatimonadales bacterium]
MSTVEPLAIAPIGTELLDDPAADPVLAAESLHNITRANRWFGGVWALRHGLRLALGGVLPGATLSLLDLGTGAGDLPLAARAWAARRGITLIPLGLERSPVAARIAHGRGIPCAVGCAGAPPIRDKSVDVVLVSQVAHHLDADSAVRLFRTCDRLARRAVIVSDLRRALPGRLAFWIGARALRFDPVTVADGMTSIRRGYTRRELRGLLAEAGIRATVARRPGYRLVAVWQPAAA